MRFSIFFAALFGAILSLAGQVLLSGNFQNAPLEIVFRKLEKQGGLAVSFDPILIKGLRATAVFERKKPDEAFAILLEKSPFAAQILQERYVIIRPKNEAAPPADELLKSPPRMVCGTILDAETGENLPFSIVFSSKSRQSTSSDSVGRFRFGLPAATFERDSLVFRCLGFLPQKVATRQFAGPVCRDVLMRPAERSVLQIVVADRAVDPLDLPKKGDVSIHLRPDRGGLAPSFGEPDPMRMLQFLPGVRSGGDKSGDLRVRGGSADQNQVLWEGIPLFHPSHLFGQLPAFNPYAVSRAEIWKGNAGAERGGWASSVIDLRGESNVPPRFSVTAGANQLSGYLGLQTPLFRRKAGLFLSGRRSYLGQKPVFQQLFGFAVLNEADFLHDSLRAFLPVSFSKDSLLIRKKSAFDDANGQFFWQPNLANRLEMSVFRSGDGLQIDATDLKNRYSSRDTVRSNSNGFRLFWQRKWAERAALSLQFVTSNYRGRFGLASEIEKNGLKNSVSEHQLNRLRTCFFRIDHRWQATAQARLDFGFQVDGLNDYFENKATRNEKWIRNEHFLIGPKTAAFYAKGRFELSKTLFLEAGGRATGFENSKKWLLDPRFNFAWAAQKSWLFKLNGGVFHQFLQQVLVLNGLGLSNEIWLAAGRQSGFRPLRSTQIAGGFLFEKKGWTVDVELFAKRLGPVGGHALRLNGEPRPMVDFRGRERATGLEMLVRKRWGRCSNWASYSLSRATARFDSIDGGARFPTDGDLRHVLNWSQTWRFGAVELATVGHLRSGLPFTPGLFVGPDGSIVYGSRNSERLGGYFRYDCSVQRTFERRRFRATAGLTVFNLFDRKNPISRRFTAEKGQQISGFDQNGLGRVANVFVLMRF